MAKEKNYLVIVDTREQKPLFKEQECIISTLNIGDYSFEIDKKSFKNEFAIERKGIADLFSTLTHGHERFHNELERAKQLKYFAIVIEGTLKDIILKNFEGSEHTKMMGFVVAKILFTIHIKYNVHVFFARDRTEAKNIIKYAVESYIKTNKL